MSTSEKRIKIFITCHKPAKYIKSNIFEPIQVNCVNSANRFSDMLHDDEGDNISELNPMYCELTAQYWAWKNSKADYYGFFHYRRYMSFAGEWREDDYGNVVEKSFGSDFLEKYGLNDENVQKIVGEYDVILPVCKDTAKMPGMGKDMYSQYAASGYLHLKDVEIMKDVIHEKCPEYDLYTENYMNGHMSYLNNMYIMKKEIFFDYCKWLFDILDECHKRIDYTNYTVEAYRTVGHLAERLFNIYIAKLRNDMDLKIKELQTVYINNTDECSSLDPAFESNNVPVVFSANNFYAPYLAVTIESLIEHAIKKNNYDIIIMNKDMTPHNKKRLVGLADGLDNVKIRFLDISSHEERFRKLFLRGHFTIETWFRLLMPEILAGYKAVLYMDADLVVNADVAELYKTDISGYLLGACHDADTAGLYNGYEKRKKKYMDEVLKIENPYNYFQAGVLLFNLDEFRKKTSVDEMLKFAGSYDWELLDQDVLNYLAQGKVKYVDMAWNVMYDWQFKRRSEIISLAPKVLRDEYEAAYASPKVVHYAGPDKPWDDPSVDYADLFWSYARKTVFYEELLARMPLLRPLAKKKDGIAKKVMRKALPKDSAIGHNARKMYAKMRNMHR